MPNAMQFIGTKAATRARGIKRFDAIHNGAILRLLRGDDRGLKGRGGSVCWASLRRGLFAVAFRPGHPG